MDIQDQESVAWAEYQIAKRNAKVRRTRTGILRQLKALDNWEKASDEKFKEGDKPKEK